MQTIKVNGQVIPQEAVQFELERLVRFYAQHGMSQEQIRAQLPKLSQRATEQAIGTKLLMEEAVRLEIPVSEADVDAQVAKLTEQVGGPEAFQAALKQQNTSVADFREQLTRGCRVEKLVEQAVSGVAEPTEADIRVYFEEHKDEFETGERVLAQHILISPDGETETSKTEARAKIESIRQRVADGADFADEASAHSMCPSGKEGGGLGWFGRGMMVPEFDKVAFDMEKGAVSDVIETQFGYHIIYKTDHEPGGTADFDQAHDKIRDLLRHERRGAAMNAYVEELKAKAQIEYA